MAVGLAASKASVVDMKCKRAIEDMVGTMFMSRTYSHMAHLKTASFAKHKALNEFYDEIVDLADEFAEAGQGLVGKLDVPFIQMSGDVNDPISAIEVHLKTLEAMSKGCDEAYMQNIFQEVQKLYRSTLYKLKELS